MVQFRVKFRVRDRVRVKSRVRMYPKLGQERPFGRRNSHFCLLLNVM